jgi:hypothetical protein
VKATATVLPKVLAVAGVSSWAVVVGVVASAVLGTLSASADRSLAQFSFWHHYVPREAAAVRRWTFAAHAAAGLAGGLALSLLVNWFPFGKGELQVALAGIAWAGLSEALLRAEVLAVDMSAAKPGISLLRKVLAAQYGKLERSLDAEINERINGRTSTLDGLVALLIECLGLSTQTGLAQSGASTVICDLVARLNGPPEQHAAAKVAALKEIRHEVTAGQRRI